MLLSQRISCQAGSVVQRGAGTAIASFYVVDGQILDGAGVASIRADGRVMAVPVDRVVEHAGPTPDGGDQVPTPSLVHGDDPPAPQSALYP
jgi:hypothetical protein